MEDDAAHGDDGQSRDRRRIENLPKRSPTLVHSERSHIKFR
jgi:hypothetical protein